MNLVRAAVNQYEVVRLLTLREARSHHAESQLGYLWSLSDPLAWVLMFYLAFVYGGRTGPQHGMEILPYLATGVCTFKAFQSVSACIPVRLPTRLLALPQVTSIDIILSKALLEAVTMVLVFLVLVGGATLASGQFTPVDEILMVVVGMFLAVTLGLGFALTLTAGRRLSKIFGTIHTVIGRILFWTSGMFFVAEDLPSAARDVMLWNPVLHAVELVRGGWFVGYRAVHADPMYALNWAVTLLLVGLVCERLTRERHP